MAGVGVGAGAYYLPDLSTGYLPLFVLIVRHLQVYAHFHRQSSILDSTRHSEPVLTEKLNTGRNHSNNKFHLLLPRHAQSTTHLQSSRLRDE